MTLGRRLIITNAAFIAAIAILGAVSLWGMVRMKKDVQSLMLEHQELRWIDEVSITVAEVMGAMREEFADREYLLSRLDEAIGLTMPLYEMQAHEEHVHEEHGVRELSLIKQVLNGLKSMRDRQVRPSLLIWAWHRETSIAEASGVLDLLNALAAETLAEVRASQEEAAATIRLTIGICLSLCLALIIAAVLLGLRQHRAITTPLRVLQRGVRKVANGKFDQALAAAGDDEFVSLTDDFNRMSLELAALYNDLEGKVAQRSRQLVRSERLASVGFLAAGVAHEINNPLAIISTYAELSLRDLESLPASASVEQIGESLQVMKEEAFRCKSITEKLLTLSRMGDGSRGPVNIRKCIDDVVAMVARLPRFRDRQLMSIVDELNGITIQGNDAELKQVLLNLIVNAMEAVTQQGKVSIQASTTEAAIEIRVTDNGCGMTSETIEHLFEPFYTRKQSNGEHGSGLGLSICHAIIESHHGRITAQSEGPGMGTTFTLVLPRSAHPLTAREFEVIHE